MARSKYKVANMSELPEENVKTTSSKYAKMEQELSIDMEEAEPTPEIATEEVAETAQPTAEAKSEKKVHVRSKRYQEARGRIDRTKAYSLSDAFSILKGLSHAKFDESIELHLVCKEVMSNLEVSFPHSTGKKVRVEIFSDDLIEKLDKGIIEFDVLLATPAQMGKLTKYARVLGPKGLMPNPKNGTLIADPEKRKNELSSGKQTVKGEKKAPLMHVTIGKASMETQALVDNAKALLSACGEGKVLKATVCSSMSPGIRVQIA